MKSMLKVVLIGLVSVSVFFLAGCQNTVKGFGQDMQKNGREVQKSVNE